MVYFRLLAKYNNIRAVYLVRTFHGRTKCMNTRAVAGTRWSSTLRFLKCIYLSPPPPKARVFVYLVRTWNILTRCTGCYLHMLYTMFRSDLLRESKAAVACSSWGRALSRSLCASSAMLSTFFVSISVTSSSSFTTARTLFTFIRSSSISCSKCSVSWNMKMKNVVIK